MGFSRLHPSVLFVYFVSVIVFTMCVFHPLFAALSFGASLLLMLLIKKDKALKTLCGEIVLFALISLINPFFGTNGSTVLFKIFGRAFTFEALCFGMCSAAAFCTALQWLACFGEMFTEDKFVSLFAPLSPSLTLLFAMVLKLVPELGHKLRRIREDRTHISRGGGESAAGKICAGTEILSALIGWALESAGDTAASMNARGYGSGERTSFAGRQCRRGEIVLLSCILLSDGFLVAALANGAAAAAFYPKIDLTDISAPVLCVYALLLLLPAIFQITELLKWHISTSRI